jgi:alkylation response protein AidB-like acyl-CoA dehydrogenase
MGETPKPPPQASLPEDRALAATAQAAASALEAAMRTADDCVGLHGGSGFIRDVVAEKLMRDAKQLALTCPTAEQLDQLAAALDLGAPLDPALVLPTPDAQAIFT